MGKFLRVLVVIILILAIASLTLATMLFSKREMLKGRTNKLEEGLKDIALLLEAEPPAAPEDPAVYPARDIADCTDEIIDNPQTSDFWDSYKQQLESIDNEFMGLKGRDDELASYYLLDVEGKPARDGRNMKITEEPGTTQGVIDDVVAHATAQLDLLTETRQQLIDVRDELVDTITELNMQKGILREKLNTIVDLNNQIMDLNRTISNLENTIEEQSEQIAGLEGDIEVLEQEKRAQAEEIETLEIAKEELKQRVVELRKLVEIAGVQGEGGPISIDGFESIKITAGAKGSVASVDQEHQFIVIEVEQSFINELVGSTTKEGYIPLVSLIVKNDSDEFISKVRIQQINQEDKLLIGEILLDWQQGPINVGDKVFYQ